jgi:parallel beta-helix repeat protein
MSENRIMKNIMNSLIIFSLINLGFIGVLTFEGVMDIDGVKAAKTIIVDCNGNGNYTKIQAAIDAAKPGDTIHVWTGTYYENVIINKTLNLIGNGTYYTTIYGGVTECTIKITANSVVLSGFLITGGSTNGYNNGLELSEVNDCIITNNTFMANYRGIVINNSIRNIIENNSFLCNEDGLYIDGDNNTIVNNICAYNFRGIYANSSKFLIIENNVCNHNARGIDLRKVGYTLIKDNQCNFNNKTTEHDFGPDINIFVEEIFKKHSGVGIYIVNSKSIAISNNTMKYCGLVLNRVKLIDLMTYEVDNNNLINNKPLYFWISKSNTIVPSGAGQVVLVNCNYITIKNQNFSNSSIGVQLISSENNTIESNRFSSNNVKGIDLTESNSNKIRKNLVIDNQGEGITINGSFNIVADNIVERNLIYGILFLGGKYCYQNRIINNSCNSHYYGITCNGYNNNISNNNLTFNSYGIYIEKSEFNEITRNFCQNNSIGINICYGSRKNNISNNNCSFNGNGIWFYKQCKYNFFTDNICNYNRDGISGYDSSFNTISNNICNDNSNYGIYAESSYDGMSGDISWDNNITHNICKRNQRAGIAIDGARFTNINNNTLTLSGIEIQIPFVYLKPQCIENNTVNSKPVYFWREVDGDKIPPGAGQIFLYNCKNIIIEGQNLSNTSLGINIISSDYITIKNNSCNNNKLYGIHLLNSDFCTITNNTCNWNRFSGINLGGRENIIENNSCSFNSGRGISIGGTLNLLKRNSCNNNVAGISVYGWTNKIIENDCLSNKGSGIEASQFSHTIINNNCKDSIIGISCGYMSDSFVINNNTMLNCSLYFHSMKIDELKSLTIDSSNTNNGKPIYFWKNRIKGVIPANAGEVILVDCDNITIQNQNLSYGTVGIQLFHSNNITIKDNNFYNNNYEAIYLENSHRNAVEDNVINDSSSVAWLIYQYDGGGTRLIDSNHNIFKNNSFNSNYIDGLTMSNSHGNKFENNIYSNHLRYGISVYNSRSNVFIKNVFKNNTKAGIMLEQTMNTKLSMNIFNSSGLHFVSDYFEHWTTHTIDSSNLINDKPIYYWKNRTGGKVPNGAGMIILANCSFVTIENQNIQSAIYGIQIAFSRNLTLINNTINSNQKAGISLYYSHFNLIKTNSIYNNNGNGIDLETCVYNKLIDNTLVGNGNGISFLGYGSYEPLRYNFSDIFIMSKYLYSFESSTFNIIYNNTISGNGNGINIYEGNNNTICYNQIQNNNRYGIYIDGRDYGNWGRWSFHNRVYHNNFISNSENAIDLGNGTFWNNENLEGNYWSHYNGKDNGAYGRKINDGIGDTQLPVSLYYRWYRNILEGDYFPLINPIDDLFPFSTPILQDPGEVSSNGNYCLSWTDCFGAIGFILQESLDSTFNFSMNIYNGSGWSFQINNKKNGTYFYRVCAYNKKYTSKWSSVVDIIVDWLPDVPKNFSITPYKGGNILNLSWEMNSTDTYKYEIFSNFTGDWSKITTINSKTTTFNHTGLIDGVQYFYNIRALDLRYQPSKFSKKISGIPCDTIGPAPPKDLKLTWVSYNSTYLEWQPNTEDDLEGYNIYRSKKQNLRSWGKPIGSVGSGIEQYMDLDLDEMTTYYYVITAFDEVPNESGFSNVASGTTTIGQYGPEINNSVKNFAIKEDHTDHSTINLFRWFKDKNNDPMLFSYKGSDNIKVYIYQGNGTVILIPDKDWSGQETLTFTASDGIFELSDNVTITVIPVNDPPGPSVIINPANDFTAKVGTPLNFSAICLDPDLPYGDKLSYFWYSNISDVFGERQNLTNIVLPVGLHQITVYVFDLADEYCAVSINITIYTTHNLPENVTPNHTEPEIPPQFNTTKPKKDDQDNDFSVIVYSSIVVVISIIIVLVFVFVVTKKDLNPFKKLKNKIIRSGKDGETISDPKPPPIDDIKIHTKEKNTTNTYQEKQKSQ